MIYLKWISNSHLTALFNLFWITHSDSISVLSRRVIMLYDDDDDDHDNDDAPIYDWNWFFGQQLTRFKRVHFFLPVST